MSKTPRFIDLYYEWITIGKLPDEGLCNSVPKVLRGSLEQLTPTTEDFYDMYKERMDTAFWDSEMRTDDNYYVCCSDFNPLRQNIILLCAAINNEL